MAKRGVWGDRMAIITPILYKRVTCATCLNYCHDDHSCMVSPIIPKINGFDYWKICKKFDLSPDYHDEAHKIQVVKVKGTNFFERGSNKMNVVTQSERVSNNTVKQLLKESSIKQKQESKIKTFSERFVDTARKKHQIELTNVPIPMLPGLNNSKCYVNQKEKLIVMTMPKIKPRKINVHHKVSENYILTDLWTRFSDSLRITITTLVDLNKSEDYEKWIVIPVFDYKDDESCGEVFYKTRGRELQGIKLVEMDEEGNLLFATGPIFEKYWTADKIKNVKIFKD